MTDRDIAELETILVARLKEWMAATFEGDAARQAEIEHEDAIFTYPDGGRYNQADHIALTGLADRVDEHDITYLRVQPFADDLAVSYVDHTLRATLKEDPFGDVEMQRRMREGITFAMTVVWRRFGADWRVISMNAHVLRDGYVPREQRLVPNIVTYP